MYVAGNNLGADLIVTPGGFQTTNPAPSCCYQGFVAKIAAIAPGPQISADSVYNAATVQTGGIAPNEFIAIKGSGTDATIAIGQIPPGALF